MQPPVDVVRVTPRGAFQYDRGGGVIHYGVDLGAEPGTVVRAPERMMVLQVATNNATPGLRRYGPAAVLARGDSGFVHVLGHLAVWPSAADRPVKGQVIAEGEPVGVVSALRHVHWEVRKGPGPWPRSSRAKDTVDPLSLVSASTSRPSSVPDASRLFRGVVDAVKEQEVANLMWVGAAIVGLWMLSKKSNG